MFKWIRKHPILSIVILLLAAIPISNVLVQNKNEAVIKQETTSTLSVFDILEYKGFDDCVSQLRSKESNLNLPISCSTLTISCDAFKAFQLSLIQLQSEIDLKYALPKDAGSIYKDFTDGYEILFIPKDSTDTFRVNWDEMIMAYKYLRVALEEGDQARIDELTSVSKESINRVTEMCSKVPPSEG